MATGNIDSFNLKSLAKGGVINEDVMQKIFDISKVNLPLTDVTDMIDKIAAQQGIIDTIEREFGG